MEYIVYWNWNMQHSHRFFDLNEMETMDWTDLMETNGDRNGYFSFEYSQLLGRWEMEMGRYIGATANGIERDVVLV